MRPVLANKPVNSAAMSIIDTLYDLDDHDSDLLCSMGNAQVRQYRNYRWLSLDGSLIQSVMDLDQPQRLINPVNIYMLLALTHTGNVNDVLNLGMGGGVFERFFSGVYPQARLHSVESDETVVHLAREYFAVDPAWPVYLQSAGRFVSASDASYDLILCDIFSGETQPRCLYADDFHANCRQRLKPAGIMVFNLVPEHEQDLLHLLLPLRRAFEFTTLLEIPGHHNVLVFASSVKFDPAANRERFESVTGMLDLPATATADLFRPLPPVERPV